MKFGTLVPVAAACLLAACSSSVPTGTSSSSQTKPALKTPTKSATTAQPVWKASPGLPTYYINSVAVCGDGSRTVGGTFFHSYGGTKARAASARDTSASSGSNGTFGTYCYDASGNQLWKDEFAGWEGVYWVDVSTDGNYAASGGWFTNTPTYQGFVRAYNAATGARLLDARTNARVNQVCLSADGTWLASAADTLRLYQLQNGAYQQISEVPATGTNASFVTIAMTADGSRIVSADSSGNITVWGNFGPKSLAILKQAPLPNSGFSHCVRVTPDGQAFVSGGAKGNFYFYNTANFLSTGLPSATQTFPGGSSVYGVAVADDASAYLGLTNQGTDAGQALYVVLATGATWTFNTQRNPNCAWINSRVGIVAIADGHPDGTPGNFYSLNAADGSLRWQYTTGNMSWPIEISASGNAIAAGSDDSNIYYFTP